MTDISNYNPHTGEITAWSSLYQRGLLNETAPYIEGHIPSEFNYIDLTDPDNPTPTERPTSPVSRTDLTLLDVPEGSKLYINGESYDAEGTVELEFPLPGTFRLRVECFPYLAWTDEVTVP